MFWVDTVPVSQKQCMLELSNLCHCVQHPWKLTSRDSWCSRNERVILNHKMSVLGIDLQVDLLISTVTIETWNCHSLPLDVSRGIHLQNLATTCQYWGVDLPNLNSSLPLCHCVQHPWKLTSRDYWSSRNKRQPLSKLKHVLRKCSGVSEKWWMLELSNLCHCIQLPCKCY